MPKIHISDWLPYTPRSEDEKVFIGGSRSALWLAKEHVFSLKRLT